MESCAYALSGLLMPDDAKRDKSPCSEYCGTLKDEDYRPLES
jgi:hypothetical protein